MATKILFVCLGNICRSPLAEGIMNHLVKQKHLPMIIDSAGTANYHIGEAPDRRTIKSAQKHGIDLSLLRARQFETNDLDNFDLIFAMDKNNFHNIRRHVKNHEQKSKVHLLLDYVHVTALSEVPDPYYGTEKDFDEVFNITFDACTRLYNKLSDHLNKSH